METASQDRVAIRRYTGAIARTCTACRLACLLAVASLVSIGAGAQDKAPEAPEPGKVTLSGLIDFYYGVNVRAPRPPGALLTPSGETIKLDNTGRAFDINDRELSFSLGELNINRTQGKGVPFGITATLTFGDTARLVHATEPGGTSSWQTIQQLYISRTLKLNRKDVTVDFGKFVTPFGAEVIESSSNDNYSRSFMFLYAIPYYHAGLRATMPLSKNVTLLGAVVNGWNNVADDNNAKSGILQMNFALNPSTSLILGYMGGSEGTGAYGPAIPQNAGNLTTHLLDVQATYAWSPKLKFGVWGDYASAAGDVFGKHISGNWLGYAGYGRYQWTPKTALAVRLEQFEDMPGAGGVGSLRTGTAGYNKLNSATVTLEYSSIRGKLLSRLEYRHDHSNSKYFGAGTGVASDQDTFYLGEVIKF